MTIKQTLLNKGYKEVNSNTLCWTSKEYYSMKDWSKAQARKQATKEKDWLTNFLAENTIFGWEITEGLSSNDGWNRGWYSLQVQITDINAEVLPLELYIIKVEKEGYQFVAGVYNSELQAKAAISGIHGAAHRYHVKEHQCKVYPLVMNTLYYDLP